MTTPFARSTRRATCVARRAFTLLEILVVLAILGLLAGLLIINVDKILGQSHESIARVFVRDTLKTPLVSYRMDLGDYPSTAQGLAVLLTAPTDKAEKWRGPYISSPDNKMPADPWGEPYQYRYPGTKNAAGYDIFSKGPDKAADTADDIGNW